jgi:hypothetical protein
MVKSMITNDRPSGLKECLFNSIELTKTNYILTRTRPKFMLCPIADMSVPSSCFLDGKTISATYEDACINHVGGIIRYHDIIVHCKLFGDPSPDWNVHLHYYELSSLL